jgi:hypothetical protein
MGRETGRRIDCICVKMDRTKLEAQGEFSVDALHQQPAFAAAHATKSFLHPPAPHQILRSVAALTAQSSR